MSSTKNNRRRCDRCGKISSNKLGEYRRANGACGYVNHEEGDTVGDTCSDCREAPTSQIATTEGDLLAALESIALCGGNLSDEVLTSRTGPNDAVQRGLMYCEARRIAREAIARATKK